MRTFYGIVAVLAVLGGAAVCSEAVAKPFDVCLVSYDPDAGQAVYQFKIDWGKSGPPVYERIDLVATDNLGFAWPQFRSDRLIRSNAKNTKVVIGVGDNSAYELKFNLVGMTKEAIRAYQAASPHGEAPLDMNIPGLTKLEGYSYLVESPSKIQKC